VLYFRENVDSIVVLPLYPFYQTVHGSLILKKISTFLENVTRHNISMESKPDESRYFFSDASTSLTVKIPPDMGITGIFVQVCITDSSFPILVFSTGLNS
jgi:hypothetical protein